MLEVPELPSERGGARRVFSGELGRGRVRVHVSRLKSSFISSLKYFVYLNVNTSCNTSCICPVSQEIIFEQFGNIARFEILLNPINLILYDMYFTFHLYLILYVT